MATASGCNVNHNRLEGIREALYAHAREQKGKVNIKESVRWLQKEVPSVTEAEALQSILLTENAILEKDIQERSLLQKLLQRQKRQIKEFEAIINRSMKSPSRNKLPPTDDLNVLRKVLDDFKQIAIRSEFTDITPRQLSEAINKIDNIDYMFSAAFQTSSQSVQQQHLQSVLDNFKRVKALFRVDSLDRNIEKQKGIIENLKSNDPDLRFLTNINKNVFYSVQDKKIINKEIELANLKKEVEVTRKKIILRERSKEGINVLGMDFTGSSAQALKKALLNVQTSGYESVRSLQFMLDASMVGVQLSPAIASILGNSAKKILTGDVAGGFTNVKNLGSALWQGIAGVLKNDYDKWTSKGSTGAYAKAKFQEIVADVDYEKAKFAKLKISESRNLSNSEEVFTSDLLNKYPVLGLIKDLSEDSMVTTLNLVRFSMFKQAIKTYKPTTKAEYEKIAESINVLTGTTSTQSQFLSGSSWLFSAPRLIYSRLALAASPLWAVNRRDAGDKAFSSGVAEMYGGYAFMLSMAALLGLDFCEDYEQSCFLKVQSDDAQFDITGGIGSIYRMMANVWVLSNGVSEDASDSTKRRWDYKKEVLRDKPLDEVMKTLVQYKLHPFLSSSTRVFTGRDFFGGHYKGWMGDPTEPIPARSEAILRSFLPITVSSVVDNYTDEESSKELATLLTFVQFFGINSYKHFDGMSTPSAKEYFDKEGHVPRLKHLAGVRNIEDQNKKEFFQELYKKKWKNKVGDILEKNNYKLSYDELLLEIKDMEKVLNSEFSEKYGVDEEEK